MRKLKFIACLVTSVMLMTSDAEAAWPPSKCDHVRVLGAGDTDEIVEYDNATLENADEEQLDALGNALDLMPDLLCQAVRRVAFINRPPEDEDAPVVDAWTNRNENQDLVYLNTWNYLPWNGDVINRTRGQRATGIQRFIHESTHNAIRLIQSQQKADPYRPRQDRADPSLWPADTQQLAKKVVKDNRLDSGVIREWQRMHDAFVEAGMARAYLDKRWKQNDGANAPYLAEAGWMSAYGGEQAIEDIAEMTSWAIIRDAANNPEDKACQFMNSQTGASIDGHTAAVFTKLGFVRTLGFISEEHYKSCVGNLKIDASGEGFHSFKDGNPDRSYTGNPRATAGRGSGEDAEWLFVNISADGTVTTSSGEVPVTASLQINVTPPVDAHTEWGASYDRGQIPVTDFSYPRGVYLIGARHNKYNRLTFTRQEDGALIVDVGQGVALIGRASADGIVGSVAVQRVFNYSGGLLSAIAGDEPVKDPTRITFRYDPK